MKYFKGFYLSESLKGQKRQIAWRLRFNKLKPGFYIITLSEDTDLLDIYSGFVLNQPYYKKHSPYVVGVGRNYSEAYDLVGDILMDVKRAQGDFDVKAYFAAN